LLTSIALFALSVICGYLAFDAKRLSVDPRELPYEAITQDRMDELRGLSRTEVEAKKDWQIRHGEIDFRSAWRFWTIISVGCLVGSAWVFFR
jgi:hypothetical protein